MQFLKHNENSWFSMCYHKIAETNSMSLLNFACRLPCDRHLKAYLFTNFQLDKIIYDRNKVLPCSQSLGSLDIIISSSLSV